MSDTHGVTVVLGGSITQLPLVDAARARGLTVAVVDGNASAPAFDIGGVHAVIVDFSDIDAVQSALERSFPSVRAVVSMGADRAVVPHALLCQRFAVPGLDVATAHRATDKQQMRAAFQAAGVDCAAGAEVDSESAARQVAATMDLPAVVKPADASGQRGVRLVHAVGNIDAAARGALGISPSGRAVIEQFIDGPEYTVDGIVEDANPRTLLVTRRLHVEEGPLGVCRCHRFPAGLEPADEAALRELAEAGVRALGIDRGATHTEIRIGPAGPAIIEIGARLSGGQLAHLCRLVTGIDPVSLVLDAALGEPLAYTDTPAVASHGAVAFATRIAGRVVRANARPALAVDGVHDAGLYVAKDDVLPALQSGAERVGYVTLVAGSDDELDARVEHALGALVVDVRPAGR